METPTNFKTGICANCGADFGLHQSETNACPKNGIEISMSAWDRGERQQWEETTWEDSGEKQLKDSAPNLYEALQGFIKLRALIEYPDKENESDQYQGEAQAIFVAFKKAEAALHLATGKQ